MRRSKKQTVLYCTAALSFLLGVGLAFVYSAVRFTGFLFCLAGGVIVLWAMLDSQSGKRKWALIAKRTLSVLLVLGVFLFAFLETEVIRWSKTDNESTVTGVIVLGAGVNGTVPSLSLRVRLDAALAYIADKPDIPIVVTGSQGPGEDISEARCMADWLIARGIDESRILVEDQADNTRENIAFSKEMLFENGYDTTAQFAVVSSDYHLCRAAMHWNLPGMVPVAAKMPEQYQYSLLTVNYYIREAFALAADLPEFLAFYKNYHLL
ncbi:MAG: YdcF family protein [Oscillospiraceae bacterium]|nr:YdcF family protein [Oscillospiraceae bacterium]